MDKLPPNRGKSRLEKTLEVASEAASLAYPSFSFFARLLKIAGNRRRVDFDEDVYTALVRMEHHVGELRLDHLNRDELFISTYFRVLPQVLQTHNKIRLEILKNVLLNTAIRSTSDEIKHGMFLDWIQELGEVDVLLLKTLKEPKAAVDSFKKESGQPGATPSLYTLIGHLIPNGIDRIMLESIIARLTSKNLLSRHAIDQRGTGVIDLKIHNVTECLTPIGKEFVDFISTPPQLKNS